MSESDLGELIRFVVQIVVWVLFAMWAWERGTGRGRTGWAWRIFQVWLPVPALITMFLMRKSQRSDCPDSKIATRGEEAAQ